MRRALIAGLLVVSALCFGGDKKPKWALTRHPAKTVEIPNLVVTPAAQKCASWAWAAGMADMLRLRGLPLSPAQLVTKAYGGEVCDDRLGDPERLAQVVAGEYSRDDGSKVRVESRYVPGLSTPDNLVASVTRGHPLLLIWRGHPYLVRGVTYVVAIAQDGEKVIEVHQILLADACAPSEKVEFRAERDDPGEVQGMMEVSVTPEPGNDWLRQPTDWLHQKPK